jgi:hypothetical protein
MTSFFDDDVIAVGELKYESNSPRKMTVAGFKKNGQHVILVWYKDQIPSDELKWDLVNLNVKGVKFQDPVFVEMITGRVYELDKSKVKISGENTSLTALPIWDSPVMITERSLVNLKTD